MSCANSIVAFMVKRLLSNEPSPETVSEVPFGSVVSVEGIVKPAVPDEPEVDEVPDTDKANGTPSATNPLIIEPFATTGIVSVKLLITSPSVLKYVAVPM